MERPNPRRFDEWRGVVQLENDIVNEPSLYDIVGLDRDTWTIVGMNIYPDHGHWIDKDEHSDSVYIYAIDRRELSDDDKKPGALHKVEGIEVVSFLCHDLTFHDIMRCMKQGQISLTAKGLVGKRITVTGLADIPVQEDSF